MGNSNKKKNLDQSFEDEESDEEEIKKLTLESSSEEEKRGKSNLKEKLRKKMDSYGDDDKQNDSYESLSSYTSEEELNLKNKEEYILAEIKNASGNYILNEKFFSHLDFFESFLDELKNNQNITGISLKYNKISKIQIDKIFEVINRHKSIKNFKMRNFKGEIICQIIEKLEKMENLRKLDLVFSNFEKIEKNFSNLLEISPKLKKLKICFTKNKTKENIRKLVEIMKKNETIEKLDFSNNYFKSDELKMLSEIFIKNKKINTIDFSMSNRFENSRDFLINLQKSETLTSINLSSIDLSQIDLENISNLLKKNNLKFLDLSDCELNANQLALSCFCDALAVNESLTVLDLSENDFFETNFSFFQFLKKNKILKSLLLEYNELNEPCLLVLCESLKENETLETLNIYENNLTENGLNAITEMLKTNKSLTSLSLNLSHLNEPMKNFAQVIKDSKKLKILDISYSEMDPPIFQAFCESIASNKSIEKLVFSDSGISDLSLLSEALKINKTIKELDLSGNDLNFTQSNFITDIFLSNDTLETVDFSSNFLQSKGAFNFIHSILLNHSLKKILLDHNSIDKFLIFQINSIIRANTLWSPSLHSCCDLDFKNSVLFFVFCLKYIEIQNKIKIPKFVLFEIIKFIDRKAYITLVEPLEKVPKKMKKKMSN